MRADVNTRACQRLDSEPFMTRLLVGHAREVKRIAWNTAPKRKFYYRDSLYVRVSAGFHATAFVGADDFKAWWVERGAKGRSRPRHTIYLATKAAGLRVVAG